MISVGVLTSKDLYALSQNQQIVCPENGSTIKGDIMEVILLWRSRYKQRMTARLRLAENS